MKNRAFTLIELLVVVLIIGILAAIAVPKYQKSVWKSRATQLEIAIKHLHDNMQDYLLANGGQYPSSYDDLFIDLPLKGSCGNLLRGYPHVDCRANDYALVYFNQYNETLSFFYKGPYKYSGFIFEEKASSGRKTPVNTLICYEQGQTGFCSLMGMTTLVEQLSSNYYYI